MLTHARIATLTTLALIALGVLAVAPSAAQAASVKAGVSAVDATWHVGASAGQYASDGTFVGAGEYDPGAHSYRRASSYGVQSRLQVRALVVEGGDGERMAVVKNDLYIPQDLLHRRTAQLLEAGDSGVTRETLTIASSHNHSSPYYSSTSWGVWTFQDVFDVRFFDYYAKRMAKAVEEAARDLRPVEVGASVTKFDKTHRHSYGGEVADDGTPAGYPVSDGDHDLVVVRFDEIGGDPLAVLVNFPLHPEFLDGNDLISADYLGSLERMVDRETDALTIFTQGAVGTSEPERSTYHPISERLEFTHKEYGQAEYGARLMADAVVDTWQDVAEETPDEPERFVPFQRDFEVGMEDRWFPGPLSHPYPGVSNCRTEDAVTGDPQLPVVGLPTCQGAQSGVSTLAGFLGVDDPPAPPIGPQDPGVSVDDVKNAGIPLPDNYSAPSYTGLQESLSVHLQAFRLGDILFTVCSCEEFSDQSRNIKTRTNAEQDDMFLGYDWSERCEARPDGRWDCPNPRNEAQLLDPISDERFQRMKAQVNNDAAGWNEPEYLPFAESEPTDPEDIKGNYTHTELPPEQAYKLTVTMSMANDYNGYIAPYREYQWGDHYRKSLAAWGPHGSDYMATRLVGMGGHLNGGPDVPVEPGQQKVDADLAVNDARAAALGELGATSIAAYEAGLPDDGGDPGAVEQPEDVERFAASFFTWRGGSNFTDNPRVRVERKGADGWVEYADQSGELPVTVEFPEGGETPAYLQGDQDWRWTAHFEAFAADFDTGRGDATRAGTYRFVVDGERRDGGQVVPYEVISDEFEVAPWSGITVEDVRRESDGTVSFAVGPRRTLAVAGQPPLKAEIGPIDYPDTYESPTRFVDDVRTSYRDSAAPEDASRLEWFCFHCSFRPWADAGNASSATVTVVGVGGEGERVEAVERDGRWVTTRPLAAGETAVVGAGCVRDRFGNFNGAASSPVGPGEAGGVDASCAAPAEPGPGSGDDPGDGDSGAGDGTRGDTGGQDGRFGGSDQRSDGQGQRTPQGGTGGGDRRDGRRGRARGPRCARPTGRLRGRALGRARLGRSRAANRRAFPRGRRPRRRVDRFCLTDGRHVRVGYPSSALLAGMGSAQRRRLRGRAIFVASASKRYSAFGKRHGSSARDLRGRRFRVGRNVWVLRRASSATLLFKVRGGRVREVGLADSRLTATRAGAARYLRSFN